MEIQNLKPRRGNGTYRINNDDDLVLIEDIGALPTNKVCIENHGIILICTEGRGQFEYDGTMIQIQKNDMFLYMAHSFACNFMATSDFNCRQIWFTSSELWNINLYAKTSLSDMSYLKLHPIVHLTNDDVALLDTYFRLLCRRISDHSMLLYPEIIRSLFGTLLLEMLSMIRRTTGMKDESNIQDDTTFGFHKRRIIDRFMYLLEQSDGRIRKVDEFASQLNITPKYLSTILKQIMNRRPSIYIQLFTMEAIERRLRFTDMTMQEIANDMNFPNASFFGKYFKEHSGMTPLEYRKKYQE